MGIIIAFAAGLLLWTLVEYLLHRFVFHQHVLGKRLAREHTRHHAKVDWFAPWWLKLALAPPALLLISAPAALLLGAPGVGLGVGAVSGWLIYEVIHRRIHVAAPRNAYARWARAHHLSHHFGKVRSNHGVSSPLWDHVFGTFEAPGVVAVPRIHAQKFPWLVELRDGKPAVRSAYEGAYRVA
jgi:sterol desaturase/sphingolipid hydroxylase (fatty acid hydroxylase superfamily)